MSNRILPRRTETRERWLTHLAEHGPDKRPRGGTGYQCMQLGWTEWVHPLPDNGPWLEQITDAGREVLRGWRDHA